MLRDKETKQVDFIRHADRLCTILAEEGLAFFAEETRIETPCGPFNGIRLNEAQLVCGVSIIRSGDILLNAVQTVEPSIKVGKILIQRDESDPEKKPKLYYTKLPHCIGRCKVLLCDPMLATGGSAICATREIIAAGVKEEDICFICCVSCPEGVAKFGEAFPNIQVITAVLDSELNADKFIVPGLGDFGDRYFGT